MLPMDRTRTPAESLTSRQREVWRLVARGHTNAEIADILGISLDGAKWHVGELLTRLDASSRDELADRWLAERSVATRSRRWLRALAVLPSLKVAAASSAVLAGIAGAGIAGVLVWRASGAMNDGDRGAPLPAVTVATRWAPDEALRQAERELAAIITEPETAGRFARPLAPRDFTRASAAFAPGATAFDFGGTTRVDNSWTYDDGIPRDAWYFAFTARAVPLAGGRAPAGDVTVEVLIEDGKARLARQVYVESAAGTEVASSEGVRSRGARAMEAASAAAVPVAFLDGQPGTDWVGVFRSPDGMSCYPTFSAAGVAGARFCAMFEASSVQPSDLSVITTGWSGIDSRPRIIVRTGSAVASLRFILGGTTITVPVSPAPAGWPIPERFAYLTAGNWGDTFELIAFDATGNEVARAAGGTGER